MKLRKVSSEGIDDLVGDCQELSEIAGPQRTLLQAIEIYLQWCRRRYLDVRSIWMLLQAEGGEQVAVGERLARCDVDAEVVEADCTVELDVRIAPVGVGEEDSGVEESVLVEVPHGVEQGQAGAVRFAAGRDDKWLRFSNPLDVLGLHPIKRRLAALRASFGNVRVPFLAGETDREGVTDRRPPIVSEDELPDEVIQRASGVMDEISDQDTPHRIRLALKLDGDPTVPIRVNADVENVRAVVQIDRDGLIDGLKMSSGSFELQANSTEVSR